MTLAAVIVIVWAILCGPALADQTAPPVAMYEQGTMPAFHKTEPGALDSHRQFTLPVITDPFARDLRPTRMPPGFRIFLAVDGNGHVDGYTLQQGASPAYRRTGFVLVVSATKAETGRSVTDDELICQNYIKLTGG